MRQADVHAASQAGSGGGALAADGGMGARLARGGPNVRVGEGGRPRGCGGAGTEGEESEVVARGGERDGYGCTRGALSGGD